jgi:hypothetical protein
MRLLEETEAGLEPQVQKLLDGRLAQKILNNVVPTAAIGYGQDCGCASSRWDMVAPCFISMGACVSSEPHPARSYLFQIFRSREKVKNRGPGMWNPLLAMDLEDSHNVLLASTDSFRRLQRGHKLGLPSGVERRGGNVFQHLAKDDDVDGQ